MGDEEGNATHVWEDREIRFDSPLRLAPSKLPGATQLLTSIPGGGSHLDVRKGEFQIDAIDAIEDTKGNNGERGSLLITNLRMIWRAAKDNKTNLSELWATKFAAATLLVTSGVLSLLGRHRLQLHHKHSNQNREFALARACTGKPTFSPATMPLTLRLTYTYRHHRLAGLIRAHQVRSESL